MTLASVPRYDPSRIDKTGGCAIVLGGSMAGLLAARVLSDRFEEVTVIEKDPLPEDPTTRKGVPQGNHVHNMHEAGRRTIEDLFPGYSEELTKAGAIVVGLHRDFQFYIKDGLLTHGSSHIPMYCASRELIEYITRRRVRTLDNVTIRDGCQFVEYLSNDDDSAVEGVTVRDETNREQLPADLVVDATGRTSQTPGWLEEHGYQSPRADEVEIDVVYSTAFVRRPPDVRRTVAVLPSPPRTRGGVMFPVEGDRWVVTLFGIHGDNPPTNLEGFKEYASSLPVSDPERILDEYDVVSDKIKSYPFPSSIRNRYEKLDRFPNGLIVIGDAIASFNPIYGQGMSVAALEALQLHHTIANGGEDDLALRYFQRIESVVEHAWMLSVGSDSRFSQTTGPKPRGTSLVNRYLSRVIQAARTDETVSDLFTKIMVMEREPTDLFRPSIVARVLVANR